MIFNYLWEIIFSRYYFFEFSHSLCPLRPFDRVEITCKAFSGLTRSKHQRVLTFIQKNLCQDLLTRHNSHNFRNVPVPDH
jgi:hypothetical protein